MVTAKAKVGIFGFVTDITTVSNKQITMRKNENANSKS